MSHSHEDLFLSLLFQYQSTCWVALGKQPNPMSGKVERNLDLAQYCIEVLGMLEAKTKGNLSDRESRELQVALTNLRLNFVQERRSEAEAPAAEAAQVPAEDED